MNGGKLTGWVRNICGIVIFGVISIIAVAEISGVVNLMAALIAIYLAFSVFSQDKRLPLF